LQAGAATAANNVLEQGIGMATGLQKKFDWAGVAASGVGGAAGSWAGTKLKGAPVFDGNGKLLKGSSLTYKLGTSGASLLANAATRTLIEGSEFGDNVIAALPSAIGGIVGQSIGERAGIAVSEAARVRAETAVARLGNQAPTPADVRFDNSVAGNSGGIVPISDRDSLTEGVSGTSPREIDFNDTDGSMAEWAKKELVKRGLIPAARIAARTPLAIIASTLLPSATGGQIIVGMGSDFRVVDVSDDRSAGRLEYRNGEDWERVGPAEATFKDGFTRVIVHTDAAPIVLVMEGGKRNGGYFESGWAMSVGRGQTPTARAETFIYREIKLGNQGQFRGTLGLATAFKAEYQNQVDAAYARSFNVRRLPGSDKLPDHMRRGIFVDRQSNASMRVWLQRNGISEGNQGIVSIDRRLDRPEGNLSTFEYRRPDVYIPSAEIIMDAKLSRLEDSNAQIRDFRDFSRGARVFQIVPRNKST
jgi:hypothetical protein